MSIRIKKWIGIGLLAFSVHIIHAQDINILLKEANNLERVQKDNEALDKYKQVLGIEATNLKSLVRAAELSVSLGAKQTDKNTKRLYYETALSYAKRAWQADSNNADAPYVMAMTSGKMTDVETENKQIVAYVKDIYQYADKALSLNADHAKANYTMGKWHYEMVTLSGLKKAAVKLLYGGLPPSDLDKAIQYMEKCKSLDPYFVANYLDLAKAYKESRQPAKAIEVLNKLVKLPTRTGDDVALKAEGAKLLESMQ
ncbi:tetratricopeptide repeat protein [Sediminibacterium goheungense]|uniref:Regulator of microtubule dynamics protein 1 n=1 Tax=Sediminibacterium goheungense TaxID=1086393 RepID=A0A4R6IRR3_9BACT|nr:tetratricopeptide repeat protein [Sediminibacterium goheungense]TDO25142.1 tetratricopeptide repeat protein [Sediminibacterium goheungense]